MSNYPFAHKDKTSYFSGNMPPTSISPSSHRNTETFALNGQVSICHLVGMCYFYCDYFYLHLLPWRQVITFCLDTLKCNQKRFLRDWLSDVIALCMHAAIYGVYCIVNHEHRRSFALWFQLPKMWLHNI